MDGIFLSFLILWATAVIPTTSFRTFGDSRLIDEAVKQFNLKSTGMKNLFYFSELHEKKETYDGILRHVQMNFTMKETVCPKGEGYNINFCQFKTNGMKRICFACFKISDHHDFTKFVYCRKEKKTDLESICKQLKGPEIYLPGIVSELIMGHGFQDIPENEGWRT
ncbi:antibacterial peptide PMAP-36-like [Protopterus annectens]|uniref:antibacterial peptide PMAP-36-like n=1 Tax=Protopterus annectens TaxID=7888 RepID=UPI001CFB705D|nr:antibacterial peptide PMAP-36-like [Protopterus annectens]